MNENPHDRLLTGEQLAARQLAQPQNDPVYDFEHLGLKIAESLVLAAEAQVAEANSLLDQTKAVAESIREQVRVLTDSLTGLNSRLKTFGGELLEAHRKFNGDKHGTD